MKNVEVLNLEKMKTYSGGYLSTTMVLPPELIKTVEDWNPAWGEEGSGWGNRKDPFLQR